MHKVNSPLKMKDIEYRSRGDGTVDVWLRKNQEAAPETEEGPGGYNADEVYFRVPVLIPEEEIAADLDFWFEYAECEGEGENLAGASKESYISRKRAEISATCNNAIVAGIDVEIGGEKRHFALLERDQINLFAKQAQITAGATKLEYHQDGNPCKYFTPEEMQVVISAAIAHITYHQTYCNSLFQWLKDCEKASEAAVIQYGVEVPEEYQNEVLRDILSGEA